MNPYLNVEDGRYVAGGQVVDADGVVLRPDPDLAVGVVERRSGFGEGDGDPPPVGVPVVLLWFGRQVSFLGIDSCKIRTGTEVVTMMKGWQKEHAKSISPLLFS